jgi:hypothetical protein
MPLPNLKLPLFLLLPKLLLLPNRRPSLMQNPKLPLQRRPRMLLPQPAPRSLLPLLLPK